jgi:hypothetical protein
MATSAARMPEAAIVIMLVMALEVRLAWRF